MGPSSPPPTKKMKMDPEKGKEQEKEKEKAMDWSDLLADVLRKIGVAMGPYKNVLLMHAVNKWWRVVVPYPSSPLPLLPFPISGEAKSSKSRVGGHLKLFPSSILYVEPRSGGDGAWVVSMYDELPPPGQRVRVRDPLSEAVFTALPRGFPVSLESMDYKVKLISRSYSLHTVVMGADVQPPVVHSDKTIGTLWMTRKMDLTWMLLILMASFTGRTISIDPTSLELIQVAAPVHGPLTTDMHLVESVGDLYLAEIHDHYYDEEPPMSLRLDKDHGNWFQCIIWRLICRIGYFSLELATHAAFQLPYSLASNLGLFTSTTTDTSCRVRGG
ncbi:hypothetical protein OROMI_010188 [Orobanche minor]